MNIISRGIRNAFRNAIRTVSIVIILGLSIGLALTMLIARQAMQQKINTVKSSIGNTITVSPAGFSSFSSANNALTTTQLSKVQALPHVASVTESLTDRLTTIGSSQPSFGFGGQSSNTNNNGQTSLTSPVTINFNGNRAGGGARIFVNGGGQLPTSFTPPITIIGTTNPASVNSVDLTLSGGSTISGTATKNDALMSSAMASKNNLQVGSTFAAYGQMLTVAGIFTSSNQAVNGDVVVSLPTEQSLSGQSGDVTSAVAAVDSINNLSSVTTAVKSTLGSAADVVSSEDQANDAIQPLDSVKTISVFSLIGAVVAGAVIILLTMVMIVRERRREIGVLKAIGGSNVRVICQFMVEAVTLTLMGAVIGLALGVVGGNPVTSLLVKNSTSTSTTSATPTASGGTGFRGGRGGSGAGFFRQLGGNGAAANSIRTIHAAVGWNILLDGLAAALIIAVVGSAIAAGLIAKVRPAEVMRAE